MTAPTRVGIPTVLRLGPIRLDVVDRKAVVKLLLQDASRGRTCVVVTPNIHHVRLATVDPAYRSVLGRAEYLVADGWPLIVASRLLRPALPERIAGIDLVDDILHAEGPPLRVALLGGPPGAARRLAEVISDSHAVVYVNELPRGSWDNRENIETIVQELAAARPNLTLVGIGAPSQEFLADSLRSGASGPIVCCGAALEVLAGHTPRAPAFLRATGLEWAFRAAREPLRLGPRYLVAGTAFAGTVMGELATRLVKTRR